jgi:molybdate transport system permease protein
MEIDWFPLWLSLRVASLATLVSLAAGLALAYLFANVEFRGKEFLDALVTLPLVLPPTVLGYYLLVSLGRVSPIGKFYEMLFGGPLVFTWQAAVVASTVHAVPLLVRSLRAALSSLEHDYERAARSLGASEWRVFWRISVPLARRQIVAATVLAFARCLGDFGATLMVAGDIPHSTQTVSIAIYDAVEGGHTLTARLLVLAVSALTIGIVYLSNRLERRRVNL